MLLRLVCSSILFALMYTHQPWPGQLPFLVHEQYAVASYPSIVKYISGLQTADFKTYPRADLDAPLSHKEKAQKVAWHAHAESHLGDLVVSIPNKFDIS